MRKTFRKKRPSDPNQLAASVVADAIALSEGKNPHAVALSKLGASKGGKARAEMLSARRRKQIARDAAKARWGAAR